MCNVCKDPECHWGEYCYPDGKSVRLEPQDKDFHPRSQKGVPLGPLNRPKRHL